MLVWNAGQHEWLKLLAKKKKKNLEFHYLFSDQAHQRHFQPFIFRIFCHFKNWSGYFMTLWHFFTYVIYFHL